MNKTDTILLSTAYLAPFQYYCKLISYQNIYIEAVENYTKQSYRNRCNILSANGLLSLSIPVNKTDNLKVYTKDIRIDYNSRWPLIHQRAIESAYRSSPFYIYYADDIIPLFEKKFEFLLDFNTEFQNIVTELIGIKINVKFTSDFKKVENTDFDDFTDLISPKSSKQKPDNTFHCVSYYQVFEQKFGFIPNLSILDLLFNMGPSTIDVLNSCISKT